MDSSTVLHGGVVYHMDGIEFRHVRSVKDSGASGLASGTLQDNVAPPAEGPPGVIAGISPFYPPGSLGGQVRIPEYLPQATPGVAVLRRGTGAHVYLVHCLPGVDVTQVLLAPSLAPSRVCALIYDDDAWRCGSVEKLARLFCERLLADAKPAGQHSEDGLVLPPLALAGCSLGCVVAHEMALQLQEAGLEARLVLFSNNACWPPSSPDGRPKGAEWLGGDVEAGLLAARSAGAVDWAGRELQKSSPEEGLDADDVLMRVFWEHARHFGVSYASFNDFVRKTGRCSDRIRAQIAQYHPRGTFSGRTEFVMSKGSWADVPSLFKSD